MIKNIKLKLNIYIIIKVVKNNLCEYMKIDILGIKVYFILNLVVNLMDDYLKMFVIIL